MERGEEMRERVVSAPGKVLITGAYLVLERPNAGLVLSTSARFFAIVKPLYQISSSDSWSWSWADIKVLSPQLQKETTYKLSLRDFSLHKVSSGYGNDFVEQSIQAAVTAGKIIIGDDHEKKDAFQRLLLKGLEITILGSNDFYSYRKKIEATGLPLSAKSLASLPQFSLITSNRSEPNNNDTMSTKLGSSWVPEVAKTGLGSSAAMTTAVVGAVLVYLGIVNLPSHVANPINLEGMKGSLHLVHSLSQVAHCVAQGKIGSGFDISAAVYGSQRYVRFSPSIITSAQEYHESSSLQGNGKTVLPSGAIKALLDADWDCEREDYGLPPCLCLILGEPGFGGSHTPSMVGAVQKWRKEEAESANIIWEKLSFANKAVEKGLQDLKQLSFEHNVEYMDVLEGCKSETSEKWQELIEESTDIRGKIVSSLLKLRQSFEQVRCLLKEMGEAAGVPIEPPSQTALLNVTMNIRGVLFAGVPGAGGFDAVFAVVIGSSTRDVVEKEWCSRGVMTLCVEENPRGVQVEETDPREIFSLPLGSISLN